MAGVEPKEGLVFMELDNNGSGKLDGIYQEVETEAGKDYAISFAIRPRGNSKSEADEEVVVEFAGNKVGSFRSSDDGEWTTVSAVVKGTGKKDKIVFRETSLPEGNDGSGPFLDLILMTPVTETKPAEFLCSDKSLLENCSFELQVPDKTYAKLTPDLVPGWCVPNCARFRRRS